MAVPVTKMGAQGVEGRFSAQESAAATVALKGSSDAARARSSAANLQNERAANPFRQNEFP